MNAKQQIVAHLPPQVASIIQSLPGDAFLSLQEIRLRSGRPLMLYHSKGVTRTQHVVTPAEIELCVQLVSGSSIYAFLDEMVNGFLTIEGGHRIGLCGRAVMEHGVIRNIKHISGVNFRIARQVKGCADIALQHIGQARPKNTLIISPPQCGKTTLLRDIARQLGSMHKISIVDERGELCAMKNGVPQYDVGDMTDTLDLCPKQLGIPIMLRSMSPDILLTDEIAQQDIPAIKQAVSYGVTVIASAHGDDVQSTIARLTMQDIISQFGVILLLSRRNGPGTLEQVRYGAS